MTVHVRSASKRAKCRRRRTLRARVEELEGLLLALRARVEEISRPEPQLIVLTETAAAALLERTT